MMWVANTRNQQFVNFKTLILNEEEIILFLIYFSIILAATIKELIIT
jgi:hypothetical protein